MSEQILHICRDANVRVTTILSEITKREDVTEFVTTVQLVQININSLLKSKRGFSFELLKELKTALENYETLLLQLQRSGKLARFLTSNRLRKRIEDANSVLHARLEAFKKSFEEVAPEPVAPTPPSPVRSTSLAGDQPDDDAVAPLAALSLDDLFAEDEAASRMAMSVMIEDADGKQLWAELFGLETFMVPWERFVVGLSGILTHIADDERVVLQYIIDNQNTGLVNQHKFSELLKAFGPTQNCLRSVRSTLSARWFYGFLTRFESEMLLRDQPVGTFLFRFSSSQPGSLALAFSTLNEELNQANMVHVIITSCQPDGFRIQERGQQPRTFKNLADVVDFYSMYLLYPLDSRVPFEPWFEGDTSSAESIEMLTDQKPGTFLVRFSSVPGAYAVSYVGPDGSISHSKIEHDNADFQYEIRMDNVLMRFQSLADVVTFYKDTLLFPCRSVNNSLLIEASKCILKWKNDRTSQLETIYAVVADLFNVHKDLPLLYPVPEGFSDPRVDETVARLFEVTW
eukprot:TRINITY_DN15306_c0_g1_i1.p1 TRINITY_DN15306_c0_g1~~TRINITY_DN15306_c0_g1_i1.p1  ORF type:complete len:516 (+),score=160.26 TRINITY_DN15306_c0_g1_i1:67-1614(+)